MLKDLCFSLIQNKNTLMLSIVVIYIVALLSTLNNGLYYVATVFSLFFVVLIIKNIFPLKYILLWVLVFYFGVINTSLRLKDVDELLSIAPVNSEIKGTIISIPQGLSENKPKFFFDVKSIKIDDFEKEFDVEKVLVTVNNCSVETCSDLKIYNSYKLNGRLSLPFKAGNPSQFDYGNYLRNHSTYAVFYAKTYEKIDNKLDLKQKFMQGINNYRERVISIHSKYIPSPYLEILGGIVFGDDAISPTKEIKKSFVNSGLLHILAASGMNVAFIYAFFYFFMSIFKINFKIKVSLGMLMVIIYALMTGLGASIIRAATMLLFVLAGKLIDRDAHSISLLSFVAMLMLIYNPMYINDVGFQLSFIVTFGLLVMTPVIMRFKNKILNWLISVVTIPIIAQLWVIPMQIFYFNNISVYSVFANIMSVPILSVISFGGFVSSLLTILKPFAEKICEIFDFILEPFLILLVKISDFWGTLPNSTIQTSHPTVIQMLLYYSLLLIITGMLYKEFMEKYLKLLLKSFLSILIILLLTLISVKNSNLEIIAFDVGNADSFLIKTPKNEYIMIDTGKSGYNSGKSQAEIIVLKYLKDKGIKNINSIIVTHFDNDHCGGAVDLMNSLRVKNIYVNDLEHKSIASERIYDTANLRKTNLLLAKNKQVVYENNGLKIINYLPNKADDDNENSIITLLAYNDFKMLFTGDAGINAINSILKELPQDITVLKVPHHGAKGCLDNEIMTKLNPKYSLISVGENKFGHPNLYTLFLLKDTEILRTDVNNSIKIVVNSKGYKIFNYDILKKKYIKF